MSDIPEGWEAKEKDPQTQQDKVDQRRAKVVHYQRAGMNVGQIAKALGVHRNTVSKDLKEIRQEHRTRATEIEAYDELGQHIAFLENVANEAMVDYSAAEAGSSARATFLNTAMKARKAIVDLQTETGLLPKVNPAMARAEVQAVAKMSDSELEKRKEEVLRRLKESQDNGSSEPVSISPQRKTS